jgi:hypothetical protein
MSLMKRADPDPYQNVTDPEHWNPGLLRLWHWQSDTLTTRLDIIHVTFMFSFCGIPPKSTNRYMFYLQYNKNPPPPPFSSTDFNMKQAFPYRPMSQMHVWTDSWLPIESPQQDRFPHFRPGTKCFPALHSALPGSMYFSPLGVNRCGFLLP